MISRRSHWTVDPSADQLKIAGMMLADEAASQDWKDRWDKAIRLLAISGEPFCSDDVREIAGAPEDHPNAAGARFQAAARAGLIRKIGFVKSARAALHAHHVAQWVGTPKAHEAAA